MSGVGVCNGFIDSQQPVEHERTEAANEMPSENEGLPVFETGDLGMICSHGNLHFLDRLDDVVKLRAV